MLSCDSVHSLMVHALYLPDSEQLPARLARHLENCASCREEFAELRQARLLLESVGMKHDNFDDIPERVSLDGMYDRLSSELNRIDAQRYHAQSRRGLAPWSVAVGALAASLLIFVTSYIVLSSKELTPAELPMEAAFSEITNPAVSNTELMNYLSRAQVMLMQVANAEPEYGSVLPVQSKTARNMALEANVLTAVDSNSFGSSEKKLLRDIEFMLMQIANLDESNMEEGVALLQQFLQENGILFRIRLLEMRDQDLVI